MALRYRSVAPFTAIRPHCPKAGARGADRGHGVAEDFRIGWSPIRMLRWRGIGLVPTSPVFMPRLATSRFHSGSPVCGFMASAAPSAPPVISRRIPLIVTIFIGPQLVSYGLAAGRTDPHNVAGALVQRDEALRWVKEGVWRRRGDVRRGEGLSGVPGRSWASFGCVSVSGNAWLPSLAATPTRLPASSKKKEQNSLWESIV
jgi:hypothetical protein